MAIAMHYNDKEYLKAQRKLATGDMVIATMVGLVFLGAFLYTNMLLPLILIAPAAFLVEYLHALRNSYTEQIKDIERKERKRG